jgi:hypothetical protein
VGWIERGLWLLGRSGREKIGVGLRALVTCLEDGESVDAPENARVADMFVSRLGAVEAKERRH